jgi:hypothetical protein
MKWLASFLMTLMAALICTGCAGGQVAQDDSMRNINSNMNYLGVSGSTGEGGSSMDMYGQTDVGVGVRH